MRASILLLVSLVAFLLSGMVQAQADGFNMAEMVDTLPVGGNELTIHDGDLRSQKVEEAAPESAQLPEEVMQPKTSSLLEVGGSTAIDSGVVSSTEAKLLANMESDLFHASLEADAAKAVKTDDKIAYLKDVAQAHLKHEVKKHAESFLQLSAEEHSMASVDTRTQSQAGVAQFLKLMERSIMTKMQTLVHNEIVGALEAKKSDKDVLKVIENNAHTLAIREPVPFSSFLEVVAPMETCETIICLNGGTCKSNKCVCLNGHRGERCQISPVCADNPCSNGGKCFKDTCICVNGYTGRFCTTPPPPKDYCKDVRCLNGGKCKDGYCLCNGEFKGKRCEIKPKNPCMGVVCLNSSKCDNGWCKCISGFRGVNCEIDPCAGVQCLNEGKCKFGSCNCVNNWVGKHCEIDPCDSIRCENRGKCSRGKCICRGKWTGSHCTIDMETNKAYNKGMPWVKSVSLCKCPESRNYKTCSTLVNGKCDGKEGPGTGPAPKVKVLKGHRSFQFANPEYPCHFTQCLNGGKCYKGKCKCPQGFTGNLCEVDQCKVDITCKNGGVCSSGKCKCTDEWHGVSCELDKCHNIFCANGGSCKNGICRCSPDYQGKRCTQKSGAMKAREMANKDMSRMQQALAQVEEAVRKLKDVRDPKGLQQSIEEGASKVLEKLKVKESKYYKPTWQGSQKKNDVADTPEERKAKYSGILDPVQGSDGFAIETNTLHAADKLTYTAKDELVKVGRQILQDNLKYGAP